MRNQFFSLNYSHFKHQVTGPIFKNQQNFSGNNSSAQQFQQAHSFQNNYNSSQNTQNKEKLNPSIQSNQIQKSQTLYNCNHSINSKILQNNNSQINNSACQQHNFNKYRHSNIQNQNKKQFYQAKKGEHKNINTLKRHNGGTFIKKKFLKILYDIGKTKQEIDQLSLEVSDNFELIERIELELDKYKSIQKEQVQSQKTLDNKIKSIPACPQMQTTFVQSDISPYYILNKQKITVDQSTDTSDIPYVEIKDAHTSLFDRENFYIKLLETPAFVELSKYLDNHEQQNQKFNKKKFLNDMMKQMLNAIEKNKAKLNKKQQINDNNISIFQEHLIPSVTEKEKQQKPITIQFKEDINGNRVFNPECGPEIIIPTTYGRCRSCLNSKQFEGDICNPSLWEDVIKQQKERNANWMFTNILMDPAWTKTALNLKYDEIENEKWMNSIPIKELQKVGYLWMWVTNSQLESALKYLEKNNYKRVDIIYWIKVKDDWTIDDLIGYYFRHSIEICLVSQLQENKELLKELQTTHKAPCYIVNKRRQQSRKPDKIYDIIKTLMPYGDCLEIFGRQYNINDDFWTVGNESIQLKERPPKNTHNKCI